METIISIFVFIVLVLTAIKIFFPSNKLQNKFVKMGDFRGKKYGDFVRKVGEPTARTKTLNGYICSWQKGRYLITILFDETGNFVSIVNELSRK